MIEKWSVLMDKLSEDAISNNIPISGQFELTVRCNLGCRMCYVCRPSHDETAMSGELTAGEWISIAKEAKKAGMLYLLLTGGEVFIRKDFRDIYEELAHMGFFITIYSNGTLITRDTAKWLGKIPPKSMELTLYGASAGTYEKITGHAGAFENAVNGLDFLLEEGIDVQLRTTVIRDNAGDYEKLMKIADDRKTFLKFGYYISRRRGEEINGESCSGLDKIRLSPYEIAKYEKRSGEDYNKKFKAIIGDKAIIRDKDITERKGIYANEGVQFNSNENCAKSDPEYPFKCRAGRSEFWITWEGKMSACPYMEDFVDSPLKQGFANAWNQLQNTCRVIPTCSSCINCNLRSYCWTCPARLKMETGSYNKPSSYFCEWAGYRSKGFAIQKD